MAVGDAEGCYLAHSQLTNEGRIAKGTRLDPTLIKQLQNSDITSLVVARLDATDVHENDAAARIAASLAGTGVTCSKAKTGRVNLHASAAGLCLFNRDAIIAANSIDEGITVATLPENQWIPAGRMLATIKIIPYAVARHDVDTVVQQFASEQLSVAIPKPRTAAMIQTRLPTLKESVLDKTYTITEQRLAQRQATLAGESRCEHTIEALSTLLRKTLQQSADWILIAGASAISDRNDVIPQAIVAAGGVIERYGIPVDPGNLLLIARIGTTTVLGLPGCARSAKYNGLDQVLDRLACAQGLPNQWLNSLAIGGLLTEIADRPTPRVTATKRTHVGGLILAAGSSSRAGARNKLLYPLQGTPLVNHVAQLLKQSQVDKIVAVTGHEQQQVEASLTRENIRCYFNAAYTSGMASSLSAGVSALIDMDAVIVCLGDMPNVTHHVIDELISVAAAHTDKSIIIPLYQGQRGNPVLIGKLFFDTLLTLQGDVGAKALCNQYPSKVHEVEVDCAGILQDYDTEAELLGLR